MRDKNYRKGADFERKIKNKLESAGYFVIRSAGSKGPADLVAWDSNSRDESPYFFQCKTGEEGITKAEVEKLAPLSQFGSTYFAYSDHGQIRVKYLSYSGDLEKDDYSFTEWFLDKDADL